MGKHRIKVIQKIEDPNNRKVTYCKRKKGLLKKAMELSYLCDQKVFIYIYDSSKQRVIHFASHADQDLLELFNLQNQREYYSNQDYQEIGGRLINEKDNSDRDGSVDSKSIEQVSEGSQEAINTQNNDKVGINNIKKGRIQAKKGRIKRNQEKRSSQIGNLVAQKMNIPLDHIQRIVLQKQGVDLNGSKNELLGEIIENPKDQAMNLGEKGNQKSKNLLLKEAKDQNQQLKVDNQNQVSQNLINQQFDEQNLLSFFKDNFDKLKAMDQVFNCLLDKICQDHQVVSHLQSKFIQHNVADQMVQTEETGLDQFIQLQIQQPDKNSTVPKPTLELANHQQSITQNNNSANTNFGIQNVQQNSQIQNQLKSPKIHPRVSGSNIFMNRVGQNKNQMNASQGMGAIGFQGYQASQGFRQLNKQQSQQDQNVNIVQPQLTTTFMESKQQQALKTSSFNGYDFIQILVEFQNQFKKQLSNNDLQLIEDSMEIVGKTMSIGQNQIDFQIKENLIQPLNYTANMIKQSIDKKNNFKIDDQTQNQNNSLSIQTVQPKLQADAQINLTDASHMISLIRNCHQMLQAFIDEQKLIRKQSAFRLIDTKPQDNLKKRDSKMIQKLNEKPLTSVQAAPFASDVPDQNNLDFIQQLNPQSSSNNLVQSSYMSRPVPRLSSDFLIPRNYQDTKQIRHMLPSENFKSSLLKQQQSPSANKECLSSNENQATIKQIISRNLSGLLIAQPNTKLGNQSTSQSPINNQNGNQLGQQNQSQFGGGINTNIGTTKANMTPANKEMNQHQIQQIIRQVRASGPILSIQQNSNNCSPTEVVNSSPLPVPDVKHPNIITKPQNIADLQQQNPQQQINSRTQTSNSQQDVAGPDQASQPINEQEKQDKFDDYKHIPNKVHPEQVANKPQQSGASDEQKQDVSWKPCKKRKTTGELIFDKNTKTNQFTQFQKGEQTQNNQIHTKLRDHVNDKEKQADVAQMGHRNFNNKVQQNYKSGQNAAENNNNQVVQNIQGMQNEFQNQQITMLQNNDQMTQMQRQVPQQKGNHEGNLSQLVMNQENLKRKTSHQIKPIWYKKRIVDINGKPVPVNLISNMVNISKSSQLGSDNQLQRQSQLGSANGGCHQAQLIQVGSSHYKVLQSNSSNINVESYYKEINDSHNKSINQQQVALSNIYCNQAHIQGHNQKLMNISSAMGQQPSKQQSDEMQKNLAKMRQHHKVLAYQQIRGSSQQPHLQTQNHSSVSNSLERMNSQKEFNKLSSNQNKQLKMLCSQQQKNGHSQMIGQYYDDHYIPNGGSINKQIAPDGNNMQNIYHDDINDNNSEEPYEILVKVGQVYKKISLSPSTFTKTGSSVSMAKLVNDKFKNSQSKFKQVDTPESNNNYQQIQDFRGQMRDFNSRHVITQGKIEKSTTQIQDMYMFNKVKQHLDEMADQNNQPNEFQNNQYGHFNKTISDNFDNGHNQLMQKRMRHANIDRVAQKRGTLGLRDSNQRRLNYDKLNQKEKINFAKADQFNDLEDQIFEDDNNDMLIDVNDDVQIINRHRPMSRITRQKQMIPVSGHISRMQSNDFNFMDKQSYLASVAPSDLLLSNAINEKDKIDYQQNNQNPQRNNQNLIQHWDKDENQMGSKYDDNMNYEQNKNSMTYQDNFKRNEENGHLIKGGRFQNNNQSQFYDQYNEFAQNRRNLKNEEQQFDEIMFGEQDYPDFEDEDIDQEDMLLMQTNNRHTPRRGFNQNQRIPRFSNMQVNQNAPKQMLMAKQDKKFNFQKIFDGQNQMDKQMDQFDGMELQQQNQGANLAAQQQWCAKSTITHDTMSDISKLNLPTLSVINMQTNDFDNVQNDDNQKTGIFNNYDNINQFKRIESKQIQNFNQYYNTNTNNIDNQRPQMMQFWNESRVQQQRQILNSQQVQILIDQDDSLPPDSQKGKPYLLNDSQQYDQMNQNPFAPQPSQFQRKKNKHQFKQNPTMAQLAKEQQIKFNETKDQQKLFDNQNQHQHQNSDPSKLDNDNIFQQQQRPNGFNQDDQQFKVPFAPKKDKEIQMMKVKQQSGQIVNSSLELIEKQNQILVDTSKTENQIKQFQQSEKVDSKADQDDKEGNDGDGTNHKVKNLLNDMDDNISDNASNYTWFLFAHNNQAQQQQQNLMDSNLICANNKQQRLQQRNGQPNANQTGANVNQNNGWQQLNQNSAMNPIQANPINNGNVRGPRNEETCLKDLVDDERNRQRNHISNCQGNQFAVQSNSTLNCRNVLGKSNVAMSERHHDEENHGDGGSQTYSASAQSDFQYRNQIRRPKKHEVTASFPMHVDYLNSKQSMSQKSYNNQQNNVAQSNEAQQPQDKNTNNISGNNSAIKIPERYESHLSFVNNANHQENANPDTTKFKSVGLNGIINASLLQQQSNNDPELIQNSFDIKNDNSSNMQNQIKKNQSQIQQVHQNQFNIQDKFNIEKNQLDSDQGENYEDNGFENNLKLNQLNTTQVKNKGGQSQVDWNQNYDDSGFAPLTQHQNFKQQYLNQLLDDDPNQQLEQLGYGKNNELQKDDGSFIDDNCDALQQVRQQLQQQATESAFKKKQRDLSFLPLELQQEYMHPNSKQQPENLQRFTHNKKNARQDQPSQNMDKRRLINDDSAAYQRPNHPLSCYKMSYSMRNGGQMFGAMQNEMKGGAAGHDQFDNKQGYGVSATRSIGRKSKQNSAIGSIRRSFRNQSMRASKKPKDDNTSFSESIDAVDYMSKSMSHNH